MMKAIWNQILENQVLVSSCLGWITAQLLKTLIDMWYNKAFDKGRIFGSGGMPSSHSATVCALTASSARCFGFSSFEFAISFVIAMVVMYDAMGVRQETGKQAKLLNMMMEQDFWRFDDPIQNQKKLKELVGHTPLQVLIGALLGIFVEAVVALCLFK